MAPHPLVPINEEGTWTKLKEEKNAPSSSSSVATSSGVLDDPDFDFDPEAVDFQPLLVSGTGKILSYHSEDHIHHYRSNACDEDDSKSIMTANTVFSADTRASSETHVISNSDKKRQRSTRRGKNAAAVSSLPMIVRATGTLTLTLATFIFVKMLTRPQIIISGNSYQMQTTVAKVISSDVPESIISERADLEAMGTSPYVANKPLFDAVKSNNFELTRMLLEGVSTTSKETNNNYDINCEDEHGLTPLIEATLLGNVDLVKLLLSHGARAQPLPGFLHTPLRAACLTASLDLIHLLLEEGADPNAQSDGGRTPLMGACYLRPQFDDLPNRGELSFAAVQLLLSDPRVLPAMTNSFGESALDLCRRRRYGASSQLIRRAMHERGTKRRESFEEEE